MAKIRLSTKDPAPKWLRKTSNFLLIALMPALATLISNWGIKDELLVQRLLQGIIFLTAIVGGIELVLANGQKYANTYSAPNDQEQQNKVQ